MRKRYVVAAAAAAAACGAVVACRKVRDALKRRSLGEYSYPTMFGTAEVFTMQDPEGAEVRVLYVGGAFQSASYLGPRRFEPVFAYYRAFDHMFDVGLPIARVAMIGGGGFSYPKHLLTSTKDVAIDVVELDGAIVDIARRHFFVDELEASFGPQGSGRLGIYVQDGLEFMRESLDGAYDVVINDSFDGANPTVGLLTSTALAQAKRILCPDGLFMLNAVVPQDDPDILKAFMEIVAEGFDNVYAIRAFDEQFAGEDNWLVIGTDGSYRFEGTEAMLAQ